MNGKSKDTSISILGVTYSITRLPDDKMQQGAGAAELDHASILINKDIKKQRQEQRLIHEVLHIISDELELELNEKQIMGLAAGLYSVGTRIKESK
jgi:Zn-dependent peptidase ImmA (M78 family)